MRDLLRLAEGRSRFLIQFLMLPPQASKREATLEINLRPSTSEDEFKPTVLLSAYQRRVRCGAEPLGGSQRHGVFRGSAQGNLRGRARAALSPPPGSGGVLRRLLSIPVSLTGLTYAYRIPRGSRAGLGTDSPPSRHFGTHQRPRRNHRRQTGMTSAAGFAVIVTIRRTASRRLTSRRTSINAILSDRLPADARPRNHPARAGMGIRPLPPDRLRFQPSPLHFHPTSRLDCFASQGLGRATISARRPPDLHRRVPPAHQHVRGAASDNRRSSRKPYGSFGAPDSGYCWLATAGRWRAHSPSQEPPFTPCCTKAPGQAYLPDQAYRDARLRWHCSTLFEKLHRWDLSTRLPATNCVPVPPRTEFACAGSTA